MNESRAQGENLRPVYKWRFHFELLEDE